MLNQNVCTREMVINDPPRKYMFRPDGTRVLSTRSARSARSARSPRSTRIKKHLPVQTKRVPKRVLWLL